MLDDWGGPRRQRGEGGFGGWGGGKCGRETSREEGGHSPRGEGPFCGKRREEKKAREREREGGSTHIQNNSVLAYLC